jgi:hypothetical protein
MRKFFNGIVRIALMALIVTTIVPLAPVSVAQAASPNWDASGSYVFRFTFGSDYDYDVTLNQTAGALTGTGNYSDGGATTYSWTISSGSVSEDTINFDAPYTAGPDAIGATMHVTGNIFTDGVMSGTWHDDFQGLGRSGAWSAIKGAATPIRTSPSTCETGATTTVVRPSAPQGWVSVGGFADTKNGGAVNFIADSSSPAPTAALQLLTPDATAQAQYLKPTGTPIAQVNDLCYYTKQNSGPNIAAASYQLPTLVNGNSGFTTFVYEPYENGTVTTGNWQSWDVDSGLFWSTKSQTCSGGGAIVAGNGGSTLYTLAQIKTLCPSAVVLGFGVNAGSNNPAYDVETDLVRFNGDVYNFEQDIPTTPIDVTVNKVWQDANGNVMANGPTNKDDITITVTNADNNKRTCTYNANDALTCSDTITGISTDTFGVTETGVPAGYTVDSTTVGQIAPTCPTMVARTQNTLHCTITVINKQNTTSPCGTDLVANGNFELPEVTDSAQWQLFPSGTDGMGWSVDKAGTNTNGNMELQEGVSGWNANSGNQYAEVDSDMNVDMSQNLNTVIGGKYTVSLWTSPRPGVGAADNSMNVSLGGTSLGTISEDGTSLNQTTWTKHTYTFTATSAVSRLVVSGTGASNGLGGFVDDVSVTQDCLSTVTICKTDKNNNPLAGWDVFLKGPIADTVAVSGTSNADVSSTTLPKGDYELEASGTYVYRPSDPSASISDAAYSKRLPGEMGATIANPWVRENDFTTPYEGYLGIQVDDANNFNWGTTFQPSHVYDAFKTLGADSAIKFRILDDNYSDNSGGLTVKIYPVIKGTTGDNGCVTLKDVPYSENYKLDEMMQDGWTNFSGQGTSAPVLAPTANFTLVNTCTNNCASNVKICKQNEAGTPLAGWDVYLKGPQQENVTVPATSESNVTSTTSLANGQKYILTASGTANAGDNIEFDADYSYRTGSSTTWTDSVSGYESSGDQLLDLEVNGGFVNWDNDSSYNTDHTYNYMITGTGAPVSFKVNDTFPSNNSGNLNVKIYPVYDGITTQADGCATLSQLPYGAYTADEVMQSGWEKVSGTGPVTLNTQNQTFTLVNKCTSEGCVPPPTVCIPATLDIKSSTATEFRGMSSILPADLSDEAYYPAGTKGFAVLTDSDGFPGAWANASADPDVSGAVWVSNSATAPSNPANPTNGDGTIDTYRLYRQTFTIPTGATGITTPILHLTADNSVTAYINNQLIGTATDYNTVNDLSLPITLTAGNTYTLEFAVKNDAYQGAMNPTGLIYKLNPVTYSCDSGDDNNTHTITGKVYNDNSPQDGQYNGPTESPVFAGEAGLAGWTVYIDSNTGETPDNNTLDTGEQSTVSDANGNYTLSGLAPGCYTVREVLMSGWNETQPTADNDYEYQVPVGGVSCNTSIMKSITEFFVPPASALSTDPTGMNFGNVAIVPPTFSSSSSSGSKTSLTPGQVLGDVTDVPFVAPTDAGGVGQVLGASTGTLPRTGLPTWTLLMIAILALPTFGYKALTVKKV